MHHLIVITAPSGAGKTTIVHHLLTSFPELAFSVSATTRARRPHEQDGRDYYFLSPENFQQRVKENGFIEWEEVYPGQFYGTLRQEVERLWAEGRDIIFDIDVKGALAIKSAFPQQTLTIFIKPPSVDALRQRLRQRQTETPESLQRRIDHALHELAYEDQFDRVVVNDDLQQALQQAQHIVGRFIRSNF